MILKKRLEWTEGPSAGSRKTRTPKALGGAGQLLAFFKLSGQEGLSLGAPCFTGGDASFYETQELFEIEAAQGVSFEEACVIYEGEKAEDGVEAFSPLDFMPMSVSYKISYDKDMTVAEIIASIETVCLRPATAVASLCVDGMELLPSARASLGRGVTKVELRPVRLVRPKKLWPGARAQEKTVYKMTLDMGTGADLFVRDSRELAVWEGV